DCHGRHWAPDDLKDLGTDPSEHEQRKTPGRQEGLIVLGDSGTATGALKITMTRNLLSGETQECQKPRKELVQ
ncbi:hypothetical protein RUM43_003926, partial [Polyplax serrata]